MAIIATGGNVVVAQASPTLSTTAYSAGDALGGRLTFSFVNPYDEGGGTIISSVLLDKKKVNAGVTLTLFSAPISTGNSTVTDNSALAIGSADLANVVGTISFSTGSYVNFSATSCATNNGQVGYYIPNGRALYGCLRANTTPTFSTGGALTVKLFIQREKE